VGYDVYRDGQLCASTTGALTATCGNLNPKTTYGFYVNARDAAGNVSQASGTLSVKTPPSDDHNPPSVPGNVHTTSVTSTSIGLAWTASTDDVGVTGYRIFDSGTQVGTSDTASTTLGGLNPDTAYHLQVRAVDANGNLSDPSTPVLDVTTPAGRAARRRKASAGRRRSAPTTTSCGAW
jgi:chitodextrinase